MAVIEITDKIRELAELKGKSTEEIVDSLITKGLDIQTRSWENGAIYGGNSYSRKEVDRAIEKAKAAKEKAAATSEISKVHSTGKATWTKNSDFKWVAKITKRPNIDDVITITRKDGSEGLYTVTSVNMVNNASGGHFLCEVKEYREPAVVENVEAEPVKTENTPSKSITFPMSAAPSLNIPVMHDGKAVVFTGYGNIFTISEDDPSVLGSEFLGYEGERGADYYYRAATPEESSKIEVQEAAKKSMQEYMQEKGALQRRIIKNLEAGEFAHLPEDKEGAEFFYTSDSPRYDQMIAIYRSGIYFIPHEHTIGQRALRVPYSDELSGQIRKAYAK